MRLHRDDALAVRRLRLAAGAQHARLARAVDVGIQHADLRPFGLQCQRQVRRHRGLAHTALAGRHHDDVFHVRQRRQRALHFVYMDAAGDRNGRCLDRRIGFQRLAHALAQAIEHARRRVAQLEVHRYPRPVHADCTYGIGQRRAGMGIDQVAKKAADQGFVRQCHIGSGS